MVDFDVAQNNMDATQLRILLNAIQQEHFKIYGSFEFQDTV